MIPHNPISQSRMDARKANRASSLKSWAEASTDNDTTIHRTERRNQRMSAREMESWSMKILTNPVDDAKTELREEGMIMIHNG